VVEDEAPCARSIARAIRPHDVAVAASVKEALAHLRMPGWAGVFLDLGLSDGSGFEVLEWMRAHDLEVPVIILTGDSSPEVTKAAFRLRAHFLLKPVDTQEIKRFVAGATAEDPQLATVVYAWTARCNLSAAEADILRRAARGEGREMIAIARDSSAATIQKQISSLLRRTGHVTLYEAVADLLREVALR
jgi:two-component system response regulator FixJ